MSLKALIRGGQFATAIPATFATDAQPPAGTVARIATVAVANPGKDHWPHIQGRRGAVATLTVATTATVEPEGRDIPGFATATPATVATVTGGGAASVAKVATVSVANPAKDHRPHPDGGTATQGDHHRPRLHPGNGATIRGWLASIGETDPGQIAAVLSLCESDPEALGYYLRRARELDPAKVSAKVSPETMSSAKVTAKVPPETMSSAKASAKVAAKVAAETLDSPEGEPITCSCCRHWTPSRINPTGGMGLCAIHGGGRAYPWSTCPKGVRHAAG